MDADVRERVAILGAGPVGMEAALACLEAGRPFTVYEAGDRVGGNVLRWGHVRLFSPWEFNVSPRMRRHLPSASAPEAGEEDEPPTGREFVERVLVPLSRVPGLADGIRTGVRVVAVSREGLVKSDEIGTGARAHHPFRILLEDSSGTEWVEGAGTVLDCTGTYHRPNPTGDGGIPAPGEASHAHRITREIPDVEGRATEWAGRSVLVVGRGHSAQTAVRDLVRLAEGEPGTRVTWAVRREAPDWGIIPDDPLPLRSELARTAATLAGGGASSLRFRSGVVVDRIEGGGAGGAPAVDESPLEVTLRRRDGDREQVEVDRIISLTGSVGDPHLYRALQVHECYATSGPMKLAAALLGSGAGQDCLAEGSHGAETLVNPEPGFFLLGAKSYGRNSTFLMRVGWEQVTEVFSLLEG